MAPTFAEWLRWPNREVVRVAVFKPNLKLSGWTVVGGSPQTYSVSLPRFIFTTLIKGGLYRKCVGLKENGTALTLQSSIATVQANAGSWWWDEPNGLLYAQSSTGFDPDNFTVYHAQVEFRFATTGIVLNQTDGNGDTGIYHHPWLTSDVPTFSSEIEDFFYGIKITATTQITVLNEAFLWYRLIAGDSDYWWKNTPVRFYIGGRYNQGELLWSQYAADLTLLVEDVACDDQSVRFELKPLARQLNVLVPPTPYFETDYPDLGDGVRGTRKWIGYGRTIMRPDLTDTSGDGIWTIADAAYQTVLTVPVGGVTAIEKATGIRTVLTVGTEYSFSDTSCLIVILDTTYSWHTHDIEIDVTGKPDGAGGYLKTVGQIIKDLLTTFAGVAASEIDTAAFDQADLDAPEELSVWIKEPRTLATLLSSNEPGLASIEGSTLATVQQTLAGLWTIRIWTPAYDAASVVSLAAEDFTEFRPEPKIETVFQATRVFYNQDLFAKDWPIETKSDTKGVTYLANTVDVIERYTFLRIAHDAQVLAQRIQFFAGARVLEIEFAERGSRLALQRAGDKVLVTRDPAPSVTGAFTNKAFEIIRLDRAPNLAMAGRLSDVRGLGDRIGQWKAGGAAAWSALTPEERAIQPGFWADSAGLIDPGDPTSQNLSCWW